MAITFRPAPKIVRKGNQAELKFKINSEGLDIDEEEDFDKLDDCSCKEDERFFKHNLPYLNSDCIVFIGFNTQMDYINCIFTKIHQQKPKIIIKASGGQISRAISIVEQLHNLFQVEFQKKINTTLLYFNHRMVPAIEIILSNYSIKKD